MIRGKAGAPWRSVRAKIKALKDKIWSVISDIEKLRALYKEITAEKNKRTLKLVIKEGRRLLKEAAPKKGDGYLIVGLSDPYETGRAMQAAAFLYPFYESFLRVIPDFEKERIEADIKAKGRIHIYIVLLSLFKLYRDKNLKRLIKKFAEN